MRAAIGIVLTTLCLSISPAQQPRPCCPEASQSPYAGGGWTYAEQDQRNGVRLAPLGPGALRFGYGGEQPRYLLPTNDFTWRHMGEDLYYQYSPTRGVVAAYYSKSSRFYWRRDDHWEQDTSAPWAMARVKDKD